MTSATGKVEGFTFIEIFFVVLLLSILIGISLPRIKSALNSLELNSAAGRITALTDFLNRRSVVERKIIHLNIDPDSNELYAQIKDEEKRLKTYRLPEGLKIESDKDTVSFYPDGTIEPCTITLKNDSGDTAQLSSEGTYGEVKIKSRQTR